MNRTGIIIQARMGSTRLPNKMIMPFFKDQSILELIIEKIKPIVPEQLILATSVEKRDDVIVEIAKKHNCICFRGSENDVLSRFIQVAEKYKLDNLVRVCADNPFIDPFYIQTLIKEFDNNVCDYLSYSFDNNTPVIKSHIGLFAEITSLHALKKAYSKTNLPIYKEHVTNFLYENPLQFSIKYLQVPAILKGRTDIRLTIDTANDFNLCQELYSKFNSTDLSLESLIKLVDSNPSNLQKMQKEIFTNGK